MIKVMTYGTYDLLHIGHINLLRRAKALGDYLIVGLSTDEFNKIKNKDSFLLYKQRKTVLEAVKYVDKIIPEKNWEQKVNDIKKYKIDIFVMGSDWEGKFDNLKKYCKVIYLERTTNISSTSLRKSISKKIIKKNGKKN